METNTMSVASVIASQIGNKAFTMLGAKNITGDENSLTFKIGRNVKKVTHIKIALNALDLYDMTFYKVRGVNITVLSEHGGIYADMLHDIIETETGLDTKL